MFYSDLPIRSSEEDLLDRKGFARLIAESIDKLDIKDTFTIGFFGKWGSGKTSIVNAMLQELKEIQSKSEKDDKVVVVHFEPWNFTDSTQLISQFMIHLSNQLKSTPDKAIEDIGGAIEKYADALSFGSILSKIDALSSVASTSSLWLSLVSFFTKKGIKRFGKELKNGSDEKDILKQKTKVIELLEEQENRILIVIDDIDRLNDEQIRQVFQLVSSVAKFPNIIYLLVFDREIVANALDKFQDGHGDEYLEKIIQLPIQIPAISKKSLRNILLSRLDEIYKSNRAIVFSEKYWERVYEYCIEPFIHNLRDVNRLCNSVNFKLKTIAGEVEFSDMVAISVLEICYPTIYTWIKSNKGYFIGGVLSGDIFELHDKSPKECYEKYYNEIVQLLHVDKDEYKTEKEIESIIMCLSNIFPMFGSKIGREMGYYDASKLVKYNLIGHPEKFERYFHLDIDKVGIKKMMVYEAIYANPKEELAECLMEKDIEGKSYEFLEEIYSMAEEIPKDRIYEICMALIMVAGKLNSVVQYGFTSWKAKEYALDIVPKLIEKLDSGKRLELLLNIIYDIDATQMGAIGSIINSIELAHGKLAANGVRRNFPKVIHETELVKMEELFAERMKDILKTENLLLIKNWKQIQYLLSAFSPDFIDSYIKSVLIDNKNALRYLESCVTVWTGDGIEYEIKGDYEQYLTKEDILSKINVLRESGDFFALSDDVKNKCIAFYLWDKGHVAYNGWVNQFDVDKMLKEWNETFAIQ